MERVRRQLPANREQRVESGLRGTPVSGSVPA